MTSAFRTIGVTGVLSILLLQFTSSVVYAAECSLELKKLSLPKAVTAGEPYTVSVSTKVSGNPKILKGHFWWNKEGPFKFDVVSTQSQISTKLRTGNPNTYTLSVAIQYRCGFSTKMSNGVAAKLVVKKPSE